MTNPVNKHPQLSPLQRGMLVEAYISGITIARSGAAIGISRWVARQELQAAGIHLRSRKEAAAIVDWSMLPPRKIRHGHALDGRASHEYICWNNMKQRCSNPKRREYRWYGARGIYVAEKWKSFDGFLHDMGRAPSPQHSIDRIDSDGNYEPGNVRWATWAQQSANRRRGAKRKLTRDTVIAIRAARGTAKYAVLAARFGTTVATIADICLERTWKAVK